MYYVCTASLGLSVMVVLGAEVAATSVPDKKHDTQSQTGCMICNRKHYNLYIHISESKRKT